MKNPPEPPAKPPQTFYSAILGRPVTALMVFVLICVLGLVSYDRIPINLFPPGISSPEMTLFVSYPNSSPHEVSEKITKPLEDAVRTVPNVVEVTSRSSSDSSRVEVTFSPDTDMDQAYNEISDRLERTKPSFPDEVDEVRIWRFSLDEQMPIFWLGILYEEHVKDPFGIVEDLIQPRLEAAEGVAQVRVWGMVQDSVRIFLSPAALRTYGVSMYEVAASLRRDNFVLPAGTLEDGGHEFTLRIDNSFGDLDELRAFPIRTDVRLGDVAEVRYAKSVRDFVSHVNSKLSLTCVINKESDENTVEVCRNVREQFKVLEADPRLKDFSFNIYFDQSDMIVSALDNLKSSMSWGALFAILILYGFVRRLSMTLLVAGAIPVSLLAAVVCIYFSGFTFNLLSLAGFTLALGMLVDNSVVVAENIARFRARGSSALEAAILGSKQVALAITLATLTTVAVFTPMVFMAKGRNMRIFLGELAAPISFSLFASLLTALILLPIATIYLARRRDRKAVPTATEPAPPSRMTKIYQRMLQSVLHHRFLVTLLTLVVIWGGYQASQNLEQRFGGGDEEGERLRIGVTLPKHFTLEEANDVFKEIESSLLSEKDRYKFDDVSARFNRRDGRISIWYSPKNHPADITQVSRDLRRELPELPGVIYEMGFEGSEDGSIRYQIEGEDPIKLAEISKDLVRELSKIPELTAVRSGIEEGNDELRITLDRDRIQRFGVSQEILQGMISWGVGGQRLADYRGGDRTIPLIIEYEEPEVGDLGYLRALEVPVEGQEGGSVPLGAFTRYSIETSFGSIRRRNGVTNLTIRAESYDKNSYRIQRKVEETLEAYPFPEGYGFRDAGNREEWEEGMAELGLGLLIGVIFVFLLMGMLFESAILPLSVLLAIPLSTVGAMLALWITNTPLDGTARLSFLLLAGIVVNNGIVLVDRIRQVRNDCGNRTEAILIGCSQRLRPVLMTALTTIFGLLPMALPGIFATATEGGIDYQNLAIATLGGLVVSTLLTLLVVPLFYTLFDDLGGLIGRALRVGAKRNTEAAAELPS